MTKKLALVAMFGLGAAVAAPAAAEAQVLPLSIEARGGFAFPTGDFSEGYNTGYAFGATAKLRLMPLVSLYGGWERTSFDIKDAEGVSVTDAGFRLGGQVDLPLGMVTGFSPYALAGAIYNTYEVSGPSMHLESDQSLGFEAGAGVAIPLGFVLEVTPEVRYRSYKPKSEGRTADDALSYFTAGVGLQFSF